MTSKDKLLHPTRIELSVPADRKPAVEIRGEIDDWTTGRKLTPVAEEAGQLTFRCEENLPTGVYAYKFRVNRHWMLDPDNPRTRTGPRASNNMMVVGGTPEPILFAPGLPFLHHEPRGGVAITALLRDGYGPGLRIAWSEGREDTFTVMPMQAAGQEREHHVFSMHLPASTDQARFRFLLDDGTEVGSEADGEPFPVPARPAPLPRWWRDGVVYTVFLDRFRPAQDEPDWGHDPGPDEPAGGHLDGVTRSLDHLSDLGVSILHLTPIHPAGSCHRYDLEDPVRVDPGLGGEDSFRRLLGAAHDRGMRVLLDLSFLHVGREFGPYRDVRRNGTESRYAAWFQWKRKGRHRVLRHYGSRRDAPLLNLKHPEVQELVLDAAGYWARFGIDGFRLDAAAQVPLELGRAIRTTLRDHAPGALVYGEVVPEHAWRWREAGVVDAATDFSFHRATTSFVAERSIDAAQWAQQLASARQHGALPGARSTHFLSTHDHNRFATLATVRGEPNRIGLGLLMLAAFPGVPMLVYGEELGLAAEIAGLRPEGVWEDRMPMPWALSERQAAFLSLTKTLLSARARHPALRHGDLQTMFAEDRLWVARRSCDNDFVDIVVNASNLPVELDLDDDWLERLEPIVSTGETRVRGQSVSLGPNTGLLAKRSPQPVPRGVEPARARRQRQVRDLAFAAGSPESPARASRIDFSITERCNLRCQHCINHSPDRTTRHSARVLSPAVLDRLREDFAHASYFGFVHGGESLTAPIFFDVLDAIRFARAGAPTTVHLLSNGMLLNPDTTSRLIDAGVSSLSVSLDGATAETNDRIRVGSRLSTVLGHLRAADALRKERHADLRLGISFVVTKDNVHEVVDMVAIARESGADWLKLEELVPSTPRARAMYIDPASPAVRDTVQAARREAERVGIVVVDHTAPPRVWRCKLAESPEMRAFLEADQFANRSEIHPCRTPWESVCIEPNGDVHIESFHRSVLGNVMAEPLTSLWNGPVAQSERTRCRRERLCGAGPVVCLP